MALAPKLSRGAAAEIDRRVEAMFARLKARLMGGSFSGKSLFISVGPEATMSLPGIFAQAASQEGGYVDKDLMSSIADIALDLIDKQQAEAKASTKRRIQAILGDVHAGRIEPQNFRNHLESELVDLWGRINSGVERVVRTETEHVGTMGQKSAIEQVALARGVSNPVVVFIPKNDTFLCDECKKVHLLEDGVTPRCFYHSEVESGYHVRGTDKPSWMKMHPHCRCSLATVLPGFGFGADGRINYIRDGWDELAYQRETGGVGGVDARRKYVYEPATKSEPEVGEPLAKTEGYEIRHKLNENGKYATVTAHLGGEQVGRLDIGHSQAEPGYIKAVQVEVHPQHRRRGVATAMYDRAERVLGLPATGPSGSSPSNAARAFWRARKAR